MIDQSIRSIRYPLNIARFPVHRDLQFFDFSQSKVDEQLISQLTTMELTLHRIWCWSTTPAQVKLILQLQLIFR